MRLREGRGDALGLQEPQRLAGVEVLLEHQAPARREGGAHPHAEPGGPEEREGRPHADVTVEAQLLREPPAL